MLRNVARASRSALLIPAFWLGTMAGMAPGGDVQFWRVDSASKFREGKSSGVLATDSGELRLGIALGKPSTVDAVRVWDLARTPDGATWAATGDEGKVFRRKGDADAWELAHDDPDAQVFALAVAPDGAVWAGTGPGGRVVPVSAKEPKPEALGQSVLYVWDLVAGPDGTLWAATGPNGQLWKRPAAGGWTLAYDSPEPHLLAAAIAEDGAVWVGTSGRGLVVRVAADGKASVVFDAPQSDVKALRFGPGGAIYAATCQESEPGGGLRIGSGKPADNAIFRIEADGTAKEIFQAKALIYSLGWRGEQLVAGTGPEGRIFGLDPNGEGQVPLARLDCAQVLALESDGTGGLIAGLGGPAGVIAMPNAGVAKGEWTSEVLDAKQPARLGSVQWRGDEPKGTSIAFEARQGSTSEPDDSWTPWAPIKAGADSKDAASGTPRRYAQLRVGLAAEDPKSSPAIRSVSLAYRTVNLAPEVESIEVPDLAAGNGSTSSGKLELSWKGKDPNGDDLQYWVEIRREEWPDWIALTPKPISEAKYTLDASTLPQGRYRVRVRASDRLANAPGEAREAERVSEPFLLDREAPRLAIKQEGDRLEVVAEDNLTRITKAAYAIDGGEWTPIFPEDGLADSPRESFSIPLKELGPGSHVVMVRAVDAAGNTGTGDLVVARPAAGAGNP